MGDAVLSTRLQLLVEYLIAEIRLCSETERVTMMDLVGDAFCRHCGREHPGPHRWMKCKCWDDS